jgi:hypothetical protein
MSSSATTTTSSNRVGGADSLNWDEVLARAKANIAAAPAPGHLPAIPSKKRAK